MQTANDRIDPIAILAQLDRLREGIASVAAGEAAALKARAAGQVAVRREMLQREEEAAEQLSARMLGLAAVRQQETDAAYERAEARRARIQSAYHAAKAAMAERAQGMKDQRLGQVQGEIMRNRQARRDELARAAEAHAAFQAELAEHRRQRHATAAALLSALRSYRLLLRPLFTGKRKSAAPSAGHPEEARGALLAELEDARAAAQRAGRLPVPKLFYFLPLSLLLAVAVAVHGWLALRAGGPGIPAELPRLGLAAGALVAAWLLGLVSAAGVIRRGARSLAAARALGIAAEKASAARLAALEDEIRGEEEAEGRSLGDTFRESDSEWRERLHRGQAELDQQAAGLPARADRLHQRRLVEIETRYQEALLAAQAEGDARKHEIDAARAAALAELDRAFEAAVAALEPGWAAGAVADRRALEDLECTSRTRFPAWTAETCAAWEPPGEAPSAVRIGHLVVDTGQLAAGRAHDARLAMPERLEAPLALAFPASGSLLLESEDGGAARVLHAISLRLLAAHPPGRAAFVFIDPVGLGRDFAGLMHLADYEESLIHHRIWTQGTQIEERLAELNEHIEKVIQMYLRDEFATLADYNAQAGTIAEKARFLVIAGFPTAFSDTACKRLQAIASSGARCGVHLLIHRDPRMPVPDPALEDELRRACLRVAWRGDAYHLAGAPAGADVVEFDAAPAAEDAGILVHRIGRASVDSNRVQVPFSQITPPDEQMWTLTTGAELRVPIGRTGAKKLQMLAIGKGTRQHALVAGKTGSGKSTLFHVIITNLALWCSPEEVEFYLVDFKKGVEFKCYATRQLPHARVIAIESDREFALSVLRRLDGELKRRGEVFRLAGSQDLAGYRRAAGAEPMPRSLLLIDEFQEFFTEDDPVAQEASLLLDRIVRQGRAFGIHVILGSQTLGGAYTLARATLGQMVIRIALQCNEADAHLIMDDDNPAPRLLTRPGEGIYNDQAGALAANSPFQIVWLPEEERDEALDRIARKAGPAAPVPIVFEGNAPADIRENAELAGLRRTQPSGRPAAARAFLGAPNSIKGPTEAVFQRQSGSHLLIVGQSAERSLALLGISIVSLAAQFPPDGARFVVLDPYAHDAAGDGFFRKIAAALPHRIDLGGPADAPERLAELHAGLEARAGANGRDAPEVFFIVHDLQRFKALRPDDEFRFSMDGEAATTPAQAFAALLGEGGPAGIHVLAAIDTWNNVSRWIPRKLLAEFEMRVLFQMSANDSANLIDSPAATQLGLHRALFHNEHHATLETFRPYTLPADDWLREG